jgi:formamidopyrimidine-DNA glycosylase
MKAKRFSHPLSFIPHLARIPVLVSEAILNRDSGKPEILMPELPEVETMVRGIRPFVEGRRIDAVRRCRCACKPISIRPGLPTLAKRVRGTTVVAVRRVAKRVVFDLSSTDAIVIEPRMTGLMLLADPPDRDHLRLEWQLSAGPEFDAVRFWDRRGLGTVRLFNAAEFARELGAGKLGPDALSVSRAEWRERCRNTKRAVKVALLDQKWIAGIGNLYASEILNAARIHPMRPADTLSAKQVARLGDTVQSVLTEAIDNEGSTLSDATYRNALNRSGRYQSRHRVYGKRGKPCGSCGTGVVERIVQAQRSTFFCPACQPV